MKRSEERILTTHTGSHEGPHNDDLALASVIDIVLGARPMGLL